VSRYLERALAGETATRDEWNEHVIAFHRVHNRWGERTIAQMHTPGGDSSYDVLASRIKELAPGARAILDIGCGDGTLLARIAERYGPAVALTGIDLVDTDIAVARERLPAATLLTGDAIEVDMSQESQDVVTSHLAFMAMPLLDKILARARHALREPGVLAFVVEDPLADNAIFALFGRAVTAVRERFPGFVPAAPGRAAIEHAENLQALLDRAGFFGVSTEPLTVGARLSAEQLWHFIDASYPFGLLDSTTSRYLYDALAPQIATMVHGQEHLTIALRLVTAHI
jgi:trans-aconitate methyltransferase